jgi:hypothetical protein
MGERSRAPETDEDAAKLSLGELNGLISRVEFRVSHLKLSASLKKSAMKRLVWLEAQREGLHGVPAPKAGAFETGHPVIQAGCRIG